jgi:hypothetical protein
VCQIADARDVDREIRMASKRRRRKITPMNATRRQLTALSERFTNRGDFFLFVDAEPVVLLEQALGHPPAQKFRIPRATFNKLIRWYVGDTQ